MDQGVDGHWADSEAGGHLGWGFKTEVWRGPSLFCGAGAGTWGQGPILSLLKT